MNNTCSALPSFAIHKTIFISRVKCALSSANYRSVMNRELDCSVSSGKFKNACKIETVSGLHYWPHPIHLEQGALNTNKEIPDQRKLKNIVKKLSFAPAW